MSEESFTVYVIESAEGYRYIGHTREIEKRLLQHNAGLSRWTRRGRAWKLVYHEHFATRRQAILREHFFKSGQGRAYLSTQLGS